MNRLFNQLHATLYMKGNEMKEYKKTVVVTRDRKAIAYRVFFWKSESCFSRDMDGDYDAVMANIGYHEAKNFKKLFGFLPRKGSKETIEIIVRRQK